MFIHTNQPLITSFCFKNVPIFCRISDDSALIRNILHNRHVRGKEIGRVRVKPKNPKLKRFFVKSLNSKASPCHRFGPRNCQKQFLPFPSTVLSSIKNLTRTNLLLEQISRFTRIHSKSLFD